MAMLDHVVSLIEPVVGDEDVVELARETVAGGGRATLLLRITDRFRADVTGFAKSEDLDFAMAEEIALERLVEEYRAMIDPTAAVILVSATERLPLEHPALASATALVVSSSALADDALRAELARSPLPVVVAPSPSPEKVPVGV